VEPVLNDFNITVQPFSTVTRVIIDGDLKANGVSVDYFGQTLEYFAQNEVVLSAGSIASPQLLMLSGIGPKTMLESQGIDVKLDVPGVGRNLQDHPFTFLPVTTDEQGATTSPLFLWNLLDWFQLFFSGSGGLTDNGMATNGVFHTSKNVDPTRPDVQLQATSASLANTYGLGLKEAFGINATGVEIFQKPIENNYSGVLTPILLREKSRGFLTLQSASIHDPPFIHENLLDHPRDVETLIAAIQYLLTLEDTKSFKEHNMKFRAVDKVYCGQFEYNTEDYWECYVRHWTFSLYHQVGTCKMGPRSDGESVVDSKLKVHGMESLRVIDGSIMPTIVGANTNAAITMIGERGADFILDHWGRKMEDKTGDGLKDAKSEL